MNAIGLGRAPRPYRRLRLALFLIALAAATPASISLAVGPTEQTVDISKFAFVPKEITIEPGTRVRWTNHDETPHTVTSQTTPKVFSSPGLDIEDHFEFVFAKEGDFAYFCTAHPMMTGMVHVRKTGGKAP